MPSFPPLSPLTTSYFTCWGFFDLTTGVKRETLGTITIYEFFMKHGLSRQQMNYPRPGMHYWNEYVFEGYCNHRDDMIILAGYPDIPLSRPHSEESQVLRGE
jgi:hypothetical protein